MKYHFDEQIPRIGTGSIKWEQYGDPDVIAMSTADMDFRAADTISSALVRMAQEGCFNYHYKPERYYETVVRWYARRHHWHIEKEWLVNTPGVWSALHIALRAYTKPGDYVIIQTPHFNPLNNVIERAGCHIVLNSMVLKDGRYEIDFEDFERKIAEKRPSLYLLINLQNPTGRIFTKEELLRLNAICRKYHVLTVSDEVHANIAFPGHTHYPAASISDEARDSTIVVTGASKAYNVMDLTYSVGVIPNAELRRKYREALDGYDFNFATNGCSVTCVTAAFSEETDPWLDQLTEYLAENLAYLVDFMEKNVPQIKVIPTEGSYLVWMDCRGLGMTPAEMKDFFLHKAKVGLTWGEGYGAAGEGFERLNIGCPRKTLEEGLRRIRDAVNAR